MNATGHPGTSQSQDPQGQSLKPLLEGALATLQNALRPLRGQVMRVLAQVAAIAALALAATFLVETEYSSNAAFLVDRASSRASLPVGLAGIGEALGVSLDDASTQPLQYYAWLITSDQVLRTVLVDTVPAAMRRRSDRVTLGEQFCTVPLVVCPQLQFRDSVSMTKAIRWMRSKLSASVDLQTSLVNVSGSAPTRELAVFLVSRVILHANAANTAARRARADNERTFLMAREAEADQALRQIEDELRRFYEANRQFASSPTLAFEESRLKRKVDQATEAYVAVGRAARDAQLRAVRDVPAIAVVEGPILPDRKSSPKRLLVLIAALALGFGFAYGRLLLSGS